MTLKRIHSFTEFVEILQNNKYVILKYTARWCGPCKAIHPLVEEQATKRPDVKFIEVDIDHAEEQLLEEICSIPLFRAYADQKKVAELLGADKAKFVELVDALKETSNEHITIIQDSSEFPV